MRLLWTSQKVATNERPPDSLERDKRKRVVEGVCLAAGDAVGVPSGSKLRPLRTF